MFKGENKQLNNLTNRQRTSSLIGITICVNPWGTTTKAAIRTTTATTTTANIKPQFRTRTKGKFLLFYKLISR